MKKVKHGVNDAASRLLEEAQDGWTDKIFGCNEHNRVILRIFNNSLNMTTILDRERNKSLRKGP